MRAHGDYPSFLYACSFNALLCTRSYSALRAIYAEYEKISKKDITMAIKSEMSGDLEKACLAIGEGQLR